MEKNLKIVAIVQARMGSTRLPGKVMKLIMGKPMIEWLLVRLGMSQRVTHILVATSADPRNAPLVEHVRGLGYHCEIGSENDVLERYAHAVRASGADVVIRITGDCPLVDHRLVDDAVSRFLDADVDYLCNNYPPTYPDGLDIEVFSAAALYRAHMEAKEPFDREHVTPYLRRPGLFRTVTIGADEDLSALRWTVDEPADFEVIARVFEHFAPNSDFRWHDVLALQLKDPDLFNANASIFRNEGANMGTGQKLWKRAKRVIPGGNMLLSKRAEMFLPDQWPAYFSRAKGCSVWDLDGREYIDMSIMGIGTNTLGYGHPEVDAAVRQVVNDGNMSTLNCPEEVYLAERLVEIHPWAEMVRFARTGGEANAIAIRIARAATGKDKVAICGYHGWHDWYLAANLGDDHNLTGHLLPGLEPRGVPHNLRGSVLPFNYNDFLGLEKLVQEHDPGVIMMEVSRNFAPNDGFLQSVRQLANDRGIVLIFDECTSGFRQTFGGLHKLYGVEPDIAMFGKALGNGYAITAAIGRRSIMEVAQSTFISSTFWTERIGPAAALKTLEVMEREKSWETITRIGLGVTERWRELAQVHGLKIETSGLPALAGFSFNGPNALNYKTLLTQQMLDQGFLASTLLYGCTAHTPELLDRYFEALDLVFKLIADCDAGRQDFTSLLRGPVCHGGFKRLN
jgi:glutamate-1-semialdehyde 2,1-aminomutase